MSANKTEFSKSHYDSVFFKDHKNVSSNSAKIVIPYIKTLVQADSVIDIGCGIGTWLSVWNENGVDDVFGIDGDYVNRQQLLIPEDKFMPFDLSTELTLDRKFDLATSFEVGEHIPKEFSGTFVNNISKLADVIVFSAALPGQGGTNHINEQWPSFWIPLFAKNGFLPVDCIRSKIWNNNEVAYYYRQNIIVFIHERKQDEYTSLINEYPSGQDHINNLVHPITLQNSVNKSSKLKHKLLESQDDVRVAYQNFKKSFLRKIGEKLGIQSKK
jgi:SAM-dependent methyltransferase